MYFFRVLNPMDGIQQAPRKAGSSEDCDRNSASEKIHFSEGRLIRRPKPRSKPKNLKQITPHRNRRQNPQSQHSRQSPRPTITQ